MLAGRLLTGADVMENIAAVIIESTLSQRARHHKDGKQTSMRAGWYERSGPADEVITVSEMPIPQPGPGEVLVRLHASGISPSDYKKRGNTKVRMEFPRIVPHSDGAGVIAALGRDVETLAVGQRVWVFNGQWERPFGTAAEYIALPALQVRPLPPTMSFIEGACLGIPAMTSHHAVFMDGPVRGKTVYVPGAAGRVGAYAVQWARWGGARVIAEVGTVEKAQAVKALGANQVLLRGQDDPVTAVLEATAGAGVERIIEIEFGGNMPISEKIIAEGGVIASYASARVPKATISVSPRRARNMSIHFIHCYTMADAAKDAAVTDIARIAADGAIQHRIAGIVPLAELARAHREAESQSGTGQMVVEIP
jgi:NADPH:quinone reductase